VGIERKVPTKEEEGEGEKERAEQTMPVALRGRLAQQVGVGDGNDEEPMGTHDVNLVQPEAQAHVDSHVECPKREGKPHQTSVPTAPYSAQKEQHDEPFDNVIEGISVRNNQRTFAECVLKKMVLMQLNGLPKEVFNDTWQARCGDIGPLAELSFGDRLAFMRVPRLFMVGQIFCVSLLFYQQFNGRFDSH